jgi:glycine hydroxymethyltransferase
MSVLDLVRRHESLRSGGINLIASENALPEEAREVLASDLQGRYHSAWYGGTRFVREILDRVEALARELFRAKHAVVSALSGNLCNLATVLAFTNPGDAVGMLPFSAGGYPLDLGFLGRRRVDLPPRPGTFEPDPDAPLSCRDLRLLVAGASYIPFPHPLPRLMGLCRPLVYDGSHVLGLVACGVFQDPLREGADALIGSTHKSFPGPQGGIVLTDSDEIASRYRALLDFDVKAGIGLVDNPHPARIAALGVALEHLLADRGYGRRVVENARALAAGLREEGVPVRFADRGFTESHQVFLDLPEREAEAYCRALEEKGIFIDVAGRMGTAEITSRGLDPDDVRALAFTLGAVYRHLRV